MPNIDSLNKYHKIHMIGIGGVSMSGIAAILKNWGFTITGSDWTHSETTDKLNQMGISVVIGHDLDLIANSDVVVYSAAISKQDPEILEAKRLDIPTIERADFLGELSRCYQDTICISGTHGKTTTTSMISLCFIQAMKDPSIQVGAYLKPLDGNYKVGNSEYFIIEACEYVESFLKLSPKAEIILNIDNDHLDYFKTFDNIKHAFQKYVTLLPDNGLLILNGDDENCLALCSHTNATVISYGINNHSCDFYADNITFNANGFPEFDVFHHHNLATHIQLSVPGKHNVLNALACLSLCHAYEIDYSAIQKALHQYTGAHRRFEYIGELNQAYIYDDYGHHPTEILATAKSLQNKQYHESWVVFQPHTYSRTKNLLDDFAQVLLEFDHIVVLDIYAAREKNTYGITSQNLVDKINSLGKTANYIPDFDECVSFLKKHINKDDIILTLGAGTVTEIGPMLLTNY